MRRLAVLVLAIALISPSRVRAQIISPGKLAAPHASLEGIRNCTQCHELRQRGSSNQRCLDCHQPLATRIRANSGLHAGFGNRNCAECHREHLGVERQLVTLDTARFDHGKTGFELKEAHRTVACRDCHTPALITARDVRTFKGQHGALGRTFLGLPRTCVGCHQDDNPHGTQFGQRTCDACHTETDWKSAPGFSHERARFRLTGEHRTVACAACHANTSPDPAHPRVRYTGLSFSTCTSCHTDVHKGMMTGTCTECHSTAGWRDVSRAGVRQGFDHGRTRFPLTAAHARVDCAVCHDARGSRPKGIQVSYAPGTERDAYPRPLFATCQSCHLDQHQGAFANVKGGPACTNCHGDRAWLPTTYDITRHNAESRFVLTGAHLAVPCNACHAGADASRATAFHIERTDCASCHAKDDPHAGQFAGRACDQCHETASFTIAAFDHGRTRYPLEGVHRTLACSTCHKIETPATGKPFRRYKPLGTTCRDCHGGA